MIAYLATFLLAVQAAFVFCVGIALIAKILLGDPAEMRDLRRMKVTATGRLEDPSPDIGDLRIRRGMRWSKDSGYEPTARVSTAGYKVAFQK